MADGTATSSTADVQVTVAGSNKKSGCCATRRAKLRAIFISMAMLSIIINLDGGAVPAALIRIEQTFELSTTEIGVLGMLVYEGIGWGSLVVGPLLRCFSAVRATQVTLFLNMLCTFAFGASTSTPMLLCFRLFIGLLQAIPAVYFPVWVDEFAPADSTTIWMAIIQGGAPLGIMAGYVFSATVTTAAPDPTAVCPASAVFDVRCAWRWPFFLQSIVLVFFFIGSLFVPKSLYDLDAKEEDDDGFFADEPPAALPPLSSRGSSRASSRASSRGRGESISETIGLYVQEAFLPMDARTPIEGVGLLRGGSAAAYAPPALSSSRRLMRALSVLSS